MSSNPETSDLTFTSEPAHLENAHELAPTGAHDDSHSPVRQKRRRRAPLTGDRTKDQMFYFVDSSSSSREKRAHVMRHHVQEKRRQRKHSTTDNDRSPQRVQDISYGTQHDDEDEGVRSDALSSSNSQLPKSSSRVSLTDIDARITMPDFSKGITPVIESEEDEELVGYWVNKLTYWSGQNEYIKRKVYEQARTHPLTYKAVILAYCARWKAQLYGWTDSQEIQCHLGIAARGIEEALKGLPPTEYFVLGMSLTGMALHEDRFGNKQKAQWYTDKAAQIIRPHSGCSEVVEVFLLYVRFVTMPPPRPIGDIGKQWLLTFLRGAEEVMMKYSRAPATVPELVKAFEMEGSLFPLLSSGPRPSQVPQESRIYVVRAPTQEVCRTASLIYITATLWDLQGMVGLTNEFLATISEDVKQHKLDRYPATETLIWCLLERGHWKDAERGWSTVELLNTHKQLRPDLQFHFNEILMSYLMLTPPIRGIEEFERELNREIED